MIEHATKNAGAAPENKALAGAPENKASAGGPAGVAVRIMHVGHGKWYTVNADDERVAGPFSKTEAEAAL